MTEAIWRTRNIMLNVIRVAGVISSLAGLAMWYSIIGGFHDEAFGKLFFLAGLIEIFALPALLRLLWRYQDSRHR